MAACKAPGLLNFFGKKNKSSPPAAREEPPSPSINAQPAVAAADASPSPDAGDSDQPSAASPEADAPAAVPPTASKKPLFALFQPKSSPPAMSAESTAAVVDADGPDPASSRRNPRRISATPGTACTVSSASALTAKGRLPAGGKISATKKPISLSFAEKPSPAPGDLPPAKPTREVIDLDEVAPMFFTNSMKVAKRQKEKDAFLQLEKKKSRDTEISFFKTEKSAGKSLNSFLMSSATASAVHREPGADGSSSGGAASGPRIEFAEVVRFPQWQHVAAPSHSVDDPLVPGRPFQGGLSFSSAEEGIHSQHLRYRDNAPCFTERFSQFSQHSHDTLVDLSSSPGRAICDAAEGDEAWPHSPREPFSLDSFSLRSLWLKYVLSKAKEPIKPNTVFDISIDSTEDVSCVGGTGPGESTPSSAPSKPASDFINVIDTFTPRSSKDICSNKKHIRQFKRWLSEWVKIDDERKKKQAARELKRRNEELRLAEGGSARKEKRCRNTASEKAKTGSSSSKNIFGTAARFAPRDMEMDGEASWDENEDCSGDFLSDYDENGPDVMSKVFILQGPSGCGKSSMVMACAQELGFDVKEENTTISRAGSLMKKRVFETSQSKGMTAGAPVKPNNIFGSVSVITEDPNPRRSSSPLPTYTHGMKLILFDEADICFSDDQGMYRVIADLAKDSKCPVVITTQTDLFSSDAKTALSSIKPAPDVAVLSLPSHKEATKYVSDVVLKLQEIGALSTGIYFPGGLEADIAALTAICRGDIRACLATLQVLVNKTPSLSSNVRLITPGSPERAVTSEGNGFSSWLQSSACGEPTLCDSFNDAFELIDVSASSVVTDTAESPTVTDVKKDCVLHQYAAPVVTSVKPARINPYKPCVLHIEGRNFLQEAAHFSLCEKTADSVEVAPCFVWLCGRRFKGRVISDELLAVDLPALLDCTCDDETGLPKPDFTPSDWFYFGSQRVSLQIGGSADEAVAPGAKRYRVQSSDVMSVSKEFYRYMAADSSEYIPFMSTVSCDTYCFSQVAWVIVVDPFDVRNKTAAAARTESMLGRKKQRREPSYGNIPDLIVCKSRASEVRLAVAPAASTTTESVSGPINDTPTESIDGRGADIAIGKKRGRKNVIGDDDEEEQDATTNVTAAAAVPPSAKSNISEEVELGDVFDGDGDEVIKPANVVPIAEQRATVCSIIDECLRDPESSVFAEPVDKEQLPDYYDIILRPMDLGTIRETLLEGFYDISMTRQRDSGFKKLRRSAAATPEASGNIESVVDFDSFVQDVRLVWKNCAEYNRPESEVYAMMERMSMVFEFILERESKRIYEVFSWVYRAPPAKRGRKKRSVSKMSEGSDNKSTILSCFGRKFASKPEYIDDGDDGEDEWSDQADEASVWQSNFRSLEELASSLPALEYPTDTELCVSLKPVCSERNNRVKKLNAALHSVPGNETCTYRLQDGISDTACPYMAPASSAQDMSDLVELAALADARSDADLLNSAYSYNGPMENPFFAIQYGFTDGVALSPLTSDAMAEDSRLASKMDECAVTSNGLCGFFSGPNNASGKGGANENSESLSVEESLWSDTTFQKSAVARLCFPMNTNNSSYSFATPFSGIAWRSGWVGLNSVSDSIVQISGRLFARSKSGSNTCIQRNGPAEKTGPLGRSNPLSIYLAQSEIIGFVASNSGLWESVAGYYMNSVMINKNSQWGLTRSFVLEGLPFLRIMLRAEGELSADGKSFAGACRFAPDGDDTTDRSLFTDSVARTSTRLSLSRLHSQLSRYQYILRMTRSTEDVLESISGLGYLRYESPRVTI